MKESYRLWETLTVGKDAESDCGHFRFFIRNHLGSVQGAYLHDERMPDGRHRMEVIFDPSELDEVAWANKVREYTPTAKAKALGHCEEEKILVRREI